jgi:hypothetical protein
MHLFKPKEYLITVGIITRKQVNELRKCINSLIDNSDKSINNFEIIINVDLDDYETMDFMREFNNENTNISFIINSRQNGYSSLHEFHYDIFKLARGKYFMGMAGDNTMLTKNWNSLLINYLTEFKFYFLNYQQIDKEGNITKLENLPCYINLEDKPWTNVGKNYHDFVFYIVPQKLIELWGFISPHALVDNWLGMVAKRASYEPWNGDFYSFIEDILFEAHPPTDIVTPTTEKMYSTYQYYMNDAIFYDCVNKLQEYKQSEEYMYYHKLNIINDFRNSGKDIVEYFNLK